MPVAHGAGEYHSHVWRSGHYDSVPRLGAEPDLRLTATTVECFHKNPRVASHAGARASGTPPPPLPAPAPTVSLPLEHDHLRWTTYYQQHEGGL